MSLGVVAAAIGTVFSSAAGAGIIGSVIAGVGSALMSKKEREAEEKARIAEEQRREARFKGVGEATRLNEQGQPGEGDPTVATDITEQRVKPQKQTATPLGFREVTKKIGSRYASPVSARSPTGFSATKQTVGA